MKIIILGKTAKDKGTQLESLTKYILTSEGYTDIETNVLKSGGEIDVVAYYKHILMGEPRKTKVICECKAINESINITIWHKFIGKLHIELMSDDSTIAVMIALSGANGYVKGSFEEIKEKRKNNIRLISGDSLEHIIRSRYNITTNTDIATHVSNYIDKRISTFELAYYDDDVFWVLQFNDGAYSILSKEGNFIDSVELNNLCEMLEQNKQYYNFINIEEDFKYIQRCKYIDILAVSYLIERNKTISINDLSKLFIENESDNQMGTLSDIEIKTILSFNKYIKITDDTYTLQNIDKGNIIEFYTYLLDDLIPIKIIRSELYQQNIDKELLNMIIAIQHDINIPEDCIDNSIFLLKHSPTALLYAIKPDPKIVRNRNGKLPAYMDKVEKAHTEIFLSSLKEGFIKDYNNNTLHSLYFEEWGIKSLKIETNIVIETKQETIPISSKTTLRIIKLGGKFNDCLCMMSDLPE